MRKFVILVLTLNLIVTITAEEPPPPAAGGTCRCPTSPGASGKCCEGGGPKPAEQTTAGPQTGPPTSPGGGSTPPGKDGKKKGKCFHGDDTVFTDVGVLKMSELVGRKGVKVLANNAETATLQMSQITYWIHADPNREAKFLILSTESGQKLHISHLHLIYETDCAGNSRTVFAKKVQKGNCLYVKNENNDKLIESKIVDIEEVTKFGIYAPITEHGNIVVNNVLASCYAEYDDEEAQKILFSFMSWFKNCFELILPKSFVDIIYSTPFSSVVDIPGFLFSFIDLSKIFMR